MVNRAPGAMACVGLRLPRYTRYPPIAMSCRFRSFGAYGNTCVAAKPTSRCGWGPGPRSTHAANAATHHSKPHTRARDSAELRSDQQSSCMPAVVLGKFANTKPKTEITTTRSHVRKGKNQSQRSEVYEFASDSSVTHAPKRGDAKSLTKSFISRFESSAPFACGFPTACANLQCGLP